MVSRMLKTGQTVLQTRTYSQLSITWTLMGKKKIIRNKNENCSRQQEFELSIRSFYRNCFEGTGEESST